MPSADTNDVEIIKEIYRREDLWYQRANEAITTRIESRLAVIESRIETILQKQENIMATLADFQAKIDTINANTTASAEAAQAIAAAIAALKAEVAAAIANAGLTADQEATLLGKFDPLIEGSTALKTFLQATAATPGNEPAPVPVPPPVV